MRGVAGGETNVEGRGARLEDDHRITFAVLLLCVCVCVCGGGGGGGGGGSYNTLLQTTRARASS